MKGNTNLTEIGSQPINPLPKIMTTGRKLRDIVKDALQALQHSNNPPVFFVGGGCIIRLRTDEQNRPLLEIVNEAMMIGRLARVANFSKHNSRGVEVNCDPPAQVAKDILAIGSWSLPPIEGIVEIPILRPDGSILIDEGYDAGSRLYYFPEPGFSMALIPDYPTDLDIHKAVGLIENMIQDFPFRDPADRANMVGALLSPIVRPLIEGCVPLALIDAPQAGTGKTLLCQLVSIIGTGHYPTMIPYSVDPSELRKKISTALLANARVIVIDNLTTVLSSDMLATALTSPEWCDRLLGKNEQLKLPQRAIWLANGNNLQVGGDLPRRCYPIRLDAKVSRPWMRKEFHNSDLQSWVLEHRGELIWAILVLVRDWVLAGKPKFTGQIIGGFTDWCETIGGILEFAGIKGFLSNIDSMYMNSDEEGQQWEGFLSALYEIFREDWFTTHKITDALSTDNTFADTLPDTIGSPYRFDGEIDPRIKQKLGGELKRRIGTRYGESQFFLEFVRDGHRKINKYRVVCGNAGTSGTSYVKPTNLIPSSSKLDQVVPALPAIPAQAEERCRACGSIKWIPYPDGPGVYCCTCHPGTDK